MSLLHSDYDYNQLITTGLFILNLFKLPEVPGC